MEDFQVNPEILFQTVVMTNTTNKSIIISEYWKRMEQLKRMEERWEESKRLRDSGGTEVHSATDDSYIFMQTFTHLHNRKSENA